MSMDPTRASSDAYAAFANLQHVAVKAKNSSVESCKTTLNLMIDIIKKDQSPSNDQAKFINKRIQSCSKELEKLTDDLKIDRSLMKDENVINLMNETIKNIQKAATLFTLPIVANEEEFFHDTQDTTLIAASPENQKRSEKARRNREKPSFFAGVADAASDFLDAMGGLENQVNPTTPITKITGSNRAERFKDFKTQMGSNFTTESLTPKQARDLVIQITMGRQINPASDEGLSRIIDQCLDAERKINDTRFSALIDKSGMRVSSKEIQSKETHQIRNEVSESLQSLYTDIFETSPLPRGTKWFTPQEERQLKTIMKNDYTHADKSDKDVQRDAMTALTLITKAFEGETGRQGRVMPNRAIPEHIQVKLNALQECIDKLK